MNRLSSFRLLVFALALVSAATVGLQHTRAQGGAQTSDRDKILNSPEWKQTMKDLEQWSTVQQIYDKDQMAKLKQQFEKKIADMPADQIKEFMDDLKQKLKVLNSDEARNAREWLAETLAVAAPAYAEKIREQLPDIATLSAAQLQLQLDEYENKIAAKRKYASEFAKQREDQAQQIREQRIRNQNARLESQMAAEATPRSNYNFSAPAKVRTYTPPPYPWIWGGYRW